MSVRTLVDLTVTLQLSAVQCDCAAGSALSVQSSKIATGHRRVLSTCSVASRSDKRNFNYFVGIYLSIKSRMWLVACLTGSVCLLHQ